MIRCYDRVMRHLHCCGCGCFIPLAGVTAFGGVGGWLGWTVLT